MYMRRTILHMLATLLLAAVLVQAAVPVSAASKSLIISYDHRKNVENAKNADVDALSSATVYSGPTGEKKSTVQVIRDTIKVRKKAKVFEVRVKKTYSLDYEKTIARADQEIDRNTNLKLKKKKIPNLKKYKTVYLVTPVWHGDLPQPVRVLLRSNNFKGKTIYVCGAHLGSGFGDNISSVRELCPGAKVKKGKTYYGDAKNASVKKSVQKWLKKAA